MKIFQSLIKRGLNVKTGISPIINVSDIVLDIGKPITGNGSLIRRDSKPYSFFNFENLKCKNAVIGYEFSGYKTRRELIGELRHQNEASQKRLNEETLKIEEREIDILTLIAGGNLNDMMFSELNINSYT